MSLFSELKRRNVFRVATAYIVASWLIIQVIETIFPVFGFSDAAIRLVIILLALALGYFAYGKFVLDPKRDAALIESTTLQARSAADKRPVVDQSIAVLPFVNMSDDADNEYFSDALRRSKSIRNTHPPGQS
jgi:hypothetical protein